MEGYTLLLTLYELALLEEKLYFNEIEERKKKGNKETSWNGQATKLLQAI